jgi:hypothetical protein
VERMRQLLQPFVLRRLKNELKDQLVEKAHVMKEVRRPRRAMGKAPASLPAGAKAGPPGALPAPVRTFVSLTNPSATPLRPSPNSPGRDDPGADGAVQACHREDAEGGPAVHGDCHRRARPGARPRARPRPRRARQPQRAAAGQLNVDARGGGLGPGRPAPLAPPGGPRERRRRRGRRRRREPRRDARRRERGADSGDERPRGQRRDGGRRRRRRRRRGEQRRGRRRRRRRGRRRRRAARRHEHFCRRAPVQARLQPHQQHLHAPPQDRAAPAARPQQVHGRQGVGDGADRGGARAVRRAVHGAARDAGVHE